MLGFAKKHLDLQAILLTAQKLSYVDVLLKQKKQISEFDY